MMARAEERGTVRTWEEFVSGPLLAMESSPPRLCENLNDSSETMGLAKCR